MRFACGGDRKCIKTQKGYRDETACQAIIAVARKKKNKAQEAAGGQEYGNRK